MKIFIATDRFSAISKSGGVHSYLYILTKSKSFFFTFLGVSDQTSLGLYLPQPHG